MLIRLGWASKILVGTLRTITNIKIELTVMGAYFLFQSLTGIGYCVTVIIGG